MRILLILIHSLLLIACETTSSNKIDTIYEGRNMEGKVVTCHQQLSSTKQCSSFSIEVEQYKQKCLHNGGKVVQCNCEDVICVEENNESILVKGLDMQGQIKSCHAITADTFCPETNKAEQQFAISCKEKGNSPFRCSCNDYICSSQSI